eukprot:scaffold4493_cov390-Prasinococcus_capsulatus_cf.AAC.8
MQTYVSRRGGDPLCELFPEDTLFCGSQCANSVRVNKVREHLKRPELDLHVARMGSEWPEPSGEDPQGIRLGLHQASTTRPSPPRPPSSAQPIRCASTEFSPHSAP